MTTSTYSSPTVSEITTTASSSSCVDHPNCDILMEEFDACNDTEVAMTVCRKSCHMCDVTTMAPLCIDIHQDCQLLSDHLNVCRDEAFATTRCPKTCGVCGNMIFTDRHFILYFFQPSNTRHLEASFWSLNYHTLPLLNVIHVVYFW